MARSLLGRRHKGPDGGFSLIELIVAMVVIGVVLLLLVGVQISAAVSVTEARKLQQATAFANEAVEQMHSIPWNTINKGMYSGFLAAAGGDDLVDGDYLDIPGNTPVLLKVAPEGPTDQDPDNLARPLVNEGGSNKQVVEDPSLTGVEFTVKAYVTEPSGADTDGIVGIVVVVEWQGRRGISRTTVWSEAYRGSASGCSQNLDTQPFLAACQSYFDASSSSGSILVGISATDGIADPVPVVFPTGSVYSQSMRTASASASLRSQQVTYVDALAEYGGNFWDDNDPVTDPSYSGVEGAFTVFTAEATDDATNPSVSDDVSIGPFVQDSSQWDTETSVSDSPVTRTFRLRSDYYRSATLKASTTTSCTPGVPAGEPCAWAHINNDNTSMQSGSGYFWLDFPDGVTIRMSRRLAEVTGSTTVGNTDEAWVARLAYAPGSAEIGCTTIAGAGCVAAGATRTNADLSIGTIHSASWNEGATQGMVYIEEEPGYGTYYNDSVKVERGAEAGQMTKLPTMTRNGRVNYWTGAGYTHLDVREDTSAVVNTTPITWENADYFVTAFTQVQVLPSVYSASANADGKCEAEACTVTASVGSISMVSTYTLESKATTDTYYLIVTTLVTGPSASASYKAAPGAP